MALEDAKEWLVRIVGQLPATIRAATADEAIAEAKLALHGHLSDAEATAEPVGA